MKKNRKSYEVLMVLFLTVTLVACGTSNKETKKMGNAVLKTEKEVKEKMKDTNGKMETRSGMFQGEQNIEVNGNVEIKGNMLMLSDFSTEEGPDVHVWLIKMVI